jgi:predicted SnoaL-like aldol condensation-catalyzing enzyme
MYEPSSASLAAILFTGILIATPFSALAQEQPQNTTTTATTQQQQSPPQSNSTDQEEENNKALVRSFIEEVFNGHNLSAVDKYYTQDLIQHNLQIGNGSEGFKQYFDPIFEAFPDSHTTIEHMIAEDNLVVTFLNTTLTQTGEYTGIPPTNKTSVLRTADLFRIQNGMIVEHWDVVDSLNLLNNTVAWLLEVERLRM